MGSGKLPAGTYHQMTSSESSSCRMFGMNGLGSSTKSPPGCAILKGF